MIANFAAVDEMNGLTPVPQGTMLRAHPWTVWTSRSRIHVSQRPCLPDDDTRECQSKGSNTAAACIRGTDNDNGTYACGTQRSDDSHAVTNLAKCINRIATENLRLAQKVWSSKAPHILLFPIICIQGV